MVTSTPSAEQRFRLLYEQQQPAVLAYFLRRLPTDQAIEATSDVFVVTWRRFESVPQGEDARRWLFGVSRNVLRNHTRSARRWSRLVARAGSMSPERWPDPESVVMREVMHLEAREALGMLKPGDRELLLLRLWDEASFTEIASLEHCSRHAAEQRYARALRRLQSAFSAVGHEGVDEDRSGTRDAETRQEEQTRGA
jgi:RNA polymerase sigma factor (sigma-70 family)